MVSTKFGITTADETEFTMEVTMTLNEWKRLLVTLDGATERSGYQPELTLRRHIRQLVGHAVGHFVEVGPND